MEKIYRQCLTEAGVALAPMPEGVEHHCRENGTERFDFYLNETDQPQAVPAVSAGKELFGETEVTDTVSLEPYGVAVVRS